VRTADKEYSNHWVQERSAKAVDKFTGKADAGSSHGRLSTAKNSADRRISTVSGKRPVVIV
jgi:hypothetical protein